MSRVYHFYFPDMGLPDGGEGQTESQHWDEVADFVNKVFSIEDFNEVDFTGEEWRNLLFLAGGIDKDNSTILSHMTEEDWKLNHRIASHYFPDPMAPAELVRATPPMPLVVGDAPMPVAAMAVASDRPSYEEVADFVNKVFKIEDFNEVDFTGEEWRNLLFLAGGIDNSTILSHMREEDWTLMHRITSHYFPDMGTPAGEDGATPPMPSDDGDAPMPPVDGNAKGATV